MSDLPNDALPHPALTMKKSPSPPSPVPQFTLRRRTVVRADGRYLVYYEFSSPVEGKPCRK